MARAVTQLALDLTRPVHNEAAARVLYCLGRCLPPGALEPMYRRIVDARFEERDFHSCRRNTLCAVADMVMFDGITGSCVVTTGETIGIGWERLGGTISGMNITEGGSDMPVPKRVIFLPFDAESFGSGAHDEWYRNVERLGDHGRHDLDSARAWWGRNVEVGCGY